jgi:predicted metal-dependent phosphoesterase TrpH
VIDLHLHTTASDGRLAPAALVGRAAAAGVRILAVTDHDTTDGIDEATAEAVHRAVVVVAGIEITAVEDGRDVHMLGYFFDPEDESLDRFLAAQRAVRIRRIADMAVRLDHLGLPVDIQPLLEEARTHHTRSIGRPALARAMVTAGHVPTTRDAFETWLGQGRPAFVERAGPTPETVIETLHRAGGIASLAHPGRTRIDARIASLRDAGLDAIEAYHSDHDVQTAQGYVAVARRLELLVTGGSDFHGDPAHGLEPGTSTLPQEDWDALTRARGRHVGR